MKRALTATQIAEIEARSNLPIDGTFEAMCRDGYPTLNAPSLDCTGAVFEKSMVLRLIEQAEDEGNYAAAKCYRNLLPLFIEEVETIQ